MLSTEAVALAAELPESDADMVRGLYIRLPTPVSGGGRYLDPADASPSPNRPDFRWATELAPQKSELPGRHIDNSDRPCSLVNMRAQLHSLRGLWASVVIFAIKERDTNAILSPHWLILCHRAGLDPETAIAARMRYLDGLIINGQEEAA